MENQYRHILTGETITLPSCMIHGKQESENDGTVLHYLLSVPERHPEAAVQIVHGMCENKERYIPFMEYLAEAGYASIIHDHRGHGESAGSMHGLGDFGKGGYKALVEDIGTVCSLLKSRFHDSAIILFGHSMGSMAARSFIRRNDETHDGLVICGSPGYNPAAGTGKVLAGAVAALFGHSHRSTLLQYLSTGTFNKAFRKEKSPNSWICTDSKVVEEYDRNPLCGFPFTAEGYRNLFMLMQDCYCKDRKKWNMARPELPVLFVSGENDPCMGGLKGFNDAAKRLRDIGYMTVKTRLYSDMRHEILNETEHLRVWKDLTDDFGKMIKYNG